jgi:ADP-ribose pyrophosphatase YjhB (NUDIX family)
MIDDAKEAIEEAKYRAPDETAGLKFGFLRRLVIRDNLNRSRRLPAASTAVE